MLLLFSSSIRYDARCYFNVRSKADMSRLNLPHSIAIHDWRVATGQWLMVRSTNDIHWR